MTREYKTVAPKAKGIVVFQAFDNAKWAFDYADFVVADTKVGVTFWDREFPCKSYVDAMKRLEMRREQAEWQKAKAVADKAAAAAARTAKAAEKAAEKAKVADAKLTAAPKEQKPNQMMLLKSELQQEMQAAIAKGIADALAATQATAPQQQAAPQATA